MKKGNKEKFIETLRYLPLVIIVVLFIFFAFNYNKIGVKDILNFTPSNYLLAGVAVVAIFAIKSISMFLPLTVIYISSSIIFPWYWAIILNLIGLFVCMTIPYYIGRFSGTKLLDKLIIRYPKVNKINNFKTDNQWRFIFIVKILGFIPNDVSSLILGSLNTDYKIFIVASIIAKFPGMISTTLLGANINKPGTREFKVSIGIAIITLIFIIFMYGKNRDKIKKSL